MLCGSGSSRKNPGCPEIVLWDVLLEIGIVLLDEIGVVGLPRCRSLTLKSRQSRNVSVGDSLFLVIESASRGGGKSFEGRMRFPPGRQGKQVPVRIGVYGKGVGKWSLKEARDEWDRIRSWSKQHGKDPRDLKRQEKQALIQQSSGPTLQQACES